jgi:hypothetical protein
VTYRTIDEVKPLLVSGLGGVYRDPMMKSPIIAPLSIGRACWA